MTMNEKDTFSVIRDNLAETDMYLQLAEEASELSQAASKYIRVLRGNNPTPVTRHEAVENVLEEFADVLVCFEALFSTYQNDHVATVKASKASRWADRLMKGTAE